MYYSKSIKSIFEYKLYDPSKYLISYCVCNKGKTVSNNKSI